MTINRCTIEYLIVVLVDVVLSVLIVVVKLYSKVKSLVLERFESIEVGSIVISRGSVSSTADTDNIRNRNKIKENVQILYHIIII